MTLDMGQNSAACLGSAPRKIARGNTRRKNQGGSSVERMNGKEEKRKQEPVKSFSHKSQSYPSFSICRSFQCVAADKI